MPDNTGWRSRAAFSFECLKQEATASRGMVTTNHPLASIAGAEMLASGGNAVDAAVAAAFALTTVEPMMLGIFGGGFFLYYEAASGRVHAIDNYARAPLAATPDMFQPDDVSGPMETVGQANKVGYLSVAVPGAIMGWCHALERYGRLDIATVMEPAIRYAERGFDASPYLVRYITQEQESLASFPASAEVFLPDGRSPRPGDRIVRGDHASSLRLIARDGPNALYHGDLGRAVVEDMARNGGLITMEDLEQYRLQLREPVRGVYRGHEVVSMGPTSSGGIHIIQALNLLEGFDLRTMGYGMPEYFHLLLEVLKVCWADRREFLGDPDVVDVPVEQLTSKGYGARRRLDLDLERAATYGAGERAPVSGESANTTHLTVADADGNVVTTTQTINEAFGSRATVPGTGMVLNDCMALFDPHPGGPNSVGPGKRMLSSMSPTLVFKEGKPRLALGTPGGTRIFAAVLQGILNVIDHGMNSQEAMEAPRVWTDGATVEVEQGVPGPVRQGLEALGHKLEIVPNVAGGMNGILWDQESGLLHGAACWRADGSPVGIGGGSATLPRNL